MIYSYKCGDCSVVFERVVRLADMNVPTTEPCPECCVGGRISRHIDTGVPMGDSMKINPYRSQKGFGEVLQKIHQQNWRSNLNNKF